VNEFSNYSIDPYPVRMPTGLQDGRRCRVAVGGRGDVTGHVR